MQVYIVHEQVVELKMKPFDSEDNDEKKKKNNGNDKQLNKDEVDDEVQQLYIQDSCITLFETGQLELIPWFYQYNDTQEAIKFLNQIREDYLRKSVRLGVKSEEPIKLMISFQKNWASMDQYRAAHDLSNDQTPADEDDGHCEADLVLSGTPFKCLLFLNSFKCKVNVIAEVFNVRRDWAKDLTGRPFQRMTEQSAGMITVAEMPLTFSSDPPISVSCEEVKAKLPRVLCSQLRFDPCENLVEFTAKVSIVLVVENFEFPKSLAKITEEFVGATDFTMISTDGSRFPCHQALLEDHSEVFKIMFSQKGWKESKTDELMMTDMNTEVVEAFLKYLYVSSTDDPDKKSDLALELLKLGNKYRILNLVTRMAKILQEMLPCEFHRDVAKEMLYFSHNIGEAGKLLKTKASSVLRALAKRKYH